MLGAIAAGLAPATAMADDLRVSEDDEEEGLDLALHDERGYIL